MPLEPFETIFDGFPANTALQWKDKIVADLKGADFEKLVSTNADGIPVLPFYTADVLEKYSLAIPPKKSNGWLIAERIQVNEIELANRQALHALQHGAMCIVFDVQDKILEEEYICRLLQNIETGIAPVYFENYASEDKTAMENAAPGSCTERIGVPQLESKTDELVFALTKGMAEPSDKLIIHFSIGNNFFMEIAKLRAFRWLWKQVNDINKSNKEALIFCETGFQNRPEENENNNILRNTTEAMSAVIGGCDLLIINPHNHDEFSAFGKRIAKNVQNILLYESDFGVLQDAGKSAYYIEYLTWSLSNKVWEKLKAS